MKERKKDCSPGPKKGEMVVEINTERLVSFHDHPFKVCEDQDMLDLMESIKQYGILTPLIVRPRLDGNYEIISGHRRKHAAEQLGFYKVPVIIRSLQDDDSIICMVDSNLQRERIRPSEKAFAYRMKNDAMKRKFRQSSKYDGGQIGHKVEYKRTVEQLGAIGGDSGRQVGRFIRLTYLIPEFLSKVDEGKMGFNPAVAVSFLKEEEQKELLEAMIFTQSAPSLSQAQRMRELSKEGEFTRQKAVEILGEVKRGDTSRVIFKNEQLYQFFPKYYSPEQMRRVILEMLEDYVKKEGGEPVCAG